MQPMDTVTEWQQRLLSELVEISFKNNTSGGKDPTKTSSSASVLFTTLIPVFVIAAVQLSAFFILRRTNRQLYAPRTILTTLDDVERTPPMQKNGWFDWIPDFLKLQDESLLEKQSLDAYLFLRFFKMIILICFVGLCLTWPILFPVNITGGGKSKELDRLTIGNVKDPNRYYAHLFVSWIFLAFVMFTITRETLYYINLRQAYLLTPWNASLVSSRTVLFTSIPERHLDENYLRQVLDSVKRIWIVQDCSTIKKLADKRMDSAKKLESALVEATRSAIKNDKKKGKSTSKNVENRPTERSVLLVGKKEDAIEKHTQNFTELEEQTKVARDDYKNGRAKTAGGAFVEFQTIAAAQAAVQAMNSQAPLTMEPRSVATVPSGVIWENISIPAWETILRSILATAFIIALTIFWSIPTSFIGILSNVGELANQFKWLNWINNLPEPVLGAIEGLLPSLLLSTLVSYVPMICRYVARLGGGVTKAQIELTTQEWYFAFQVVQVFLVTTLASGATAVSSDIINNPKEVPELLAKKLPKASNFYLSYFIIYGFGQSTKNLLNWSGLFFEKFFSLFDKTPRDKYERYISMGGTGWGSWYPKFTNLAIIAISYSCIAPLTLGFATVAFSFLYIVFKYNLFYVLKTSIDTQGRAYAKALQQLTVGIYTTEFCLIGLFSISVKRHNSSSGPLILMLLFTALTVLYHWIMHRELNTLTKTLPSNIVREQEIRLSDEVEEGEGEGLLGRAPRGSPGGIRGLFLKFFEPQKYASFRTMLARLNSTRLGEPAPALPEEKESHAYEDPALSSKVPKLWIARDGLGTSKKLMQELSKEIEITDEGAWMDDKGKVHFDKKGLRDAPIWKEKLFY